MNNLNLQVLKVGNFILLILSLLTTDMPGLCLMLQPLPSALFNIFDCVLRCSFSLALTFDL